MTRTQEGQSATVHYLYEPRYDGSAHPQDLVREMAAHDVRRVLAVGMGSGVGGYREEEYASWIASHIPGAVPIAYFDPTTEPTGAALASRMAQLRSRGFCGIKIHVLR